MARANSPVDVSLVVRAAAKSGFSPESGVSMNDSTGEHDDGAAPIRVGIVS